MASKKKADDGQASEYTDETLGITIEVPGGWEVEDNPNFQLVIIAPTQHGYRANLGINTGTINSPSEDVLAKLLDQVQQEAEGTPGYQLIASENFLVDGATALLRQTHRTIDPPGIDLTQLAVLILSPSQLVFNISASSLRQDEDKYIPILKEIVHSIKFNQ